MTDTSFYVCVGAVAFTLIALAVIAPWWVFALVLGWLVLAFFGCAVVAGGNGGHWFDGGDR